MPAQVIYEGENITREIEIEDLVVNDSCGDQADGIDAILANSENQWSQWKPKKKDTLEIFHQGYSSGVMWIDRMRQESGKISLGAVSIPPAGKTKRTRVWENVSLFTIARQIASEYGLKAEFLNVPTYSYERVDQVGRGDFGFLKERAMLEDCNIKLHNKKLYIYSCVYMENCSAAKTIYASEFYEKPRFSTGDVYSSCTVVWNSYGATFNDNNAVGSQITVSDFPVSSMAEAQRFAKNILRNFNKKEYTGEISIALDTSISAGNTINIAGTGLSDGKYFIDTARHNFAEQISRLKIHKCFTRF